MISFDVLSGLKLIYYLIEGCSAVEIAGGHGGAEVGEPRGNPEILR